MTIQRLALLIVLLFVLNLERAPTYSQSGDGYIRSDRLGIAHISSGSREVPAERYRQALRLGAGWNRWPIYWQWVQTAPDTWNWDAIDRQVTQDLNYGLNINAIFIGSPDFYRDGDRIQGIQQPIFSDGSDTPGAGKSFNPDNPWVIYVWETVNRYKPGGVLSAEGTIPMGAGIRVWEVWNEPDFENFWRAPVFDYARLLKITYIVTKMADPQAQVMFGGLLYPTEQNLLAEVLNIFINDPQREDYNWYMDIVAVHSYADPWRSGWLVLFARQTMVAFGLDRPIWLNETGVPVWNDYPGPTWQPDSTNRGTLDQQAWFFIQSAAHAWAEGADKVFLHQLYDDCGDQPAGTNFPPHNGDLCVNGDLCYGDAHGIYRNPNDAVCFAEHPEPGTARPLARAYRLVADVFGTEAFDRGQLLTINRNFTTIAFERPRTNERITVMWNRTTEEDTLDLPAVGTRGRLLSMYSNNIIEPSSDGVFRVTLPPALPDTDVSSAPERYLAIGGEPYILIEPIEGEINPFETGVDDVEETPDPAEAAPAEPTLPPPRPTVDPADDTQAPVASVLPLPPTSPTTFTVSWDGSDNSGIANYLIWARVDGGEWEPWQNTAETSAEYSGSSGQTVEFAAWAVDLADNWSENINLEPQATTRIE